MSALSQSPDAQSTKRTVVVSIVSLGLAIVIFWLLFLSVDVSETLRLFADSDSRWLLALVTLTLVHHFLLSPYKWYLILRYCGVDMTMTQMVKLMLLSSTTMLTLPGKAGEILQVSYISRSHNVSFATALSTFIYNKYINLLVFMAVSLSGIYLFRPAVPSLLAVVMFAGLLLLLSSRFLEFLVRIARLRKTRFAGRIDLLLASFKDMTSMNKFVVLFVTVVQILLIGLAFYLAILTLGGRAPALETVFISNIAVLLGNIPITMSGFGTREAALVALFSKEINRELLLGAAMLFSTCFYLAPSLISLPFSYKFFRLTFRKTAENARSCSTADVTDKS